MSTPTATQTATQVDPFDAALRQELCVWPGTKTTPPAGRRHAWITGSPLSSPLYATDKCAAALRDAADALLPHRSPPGNGGTGTSSGARGDSALRPT